jgi:hypothetical protein
MSERFALFLNGVFESVLEEILRIQEFLPEHIMFLQPHSGSAIKKLEKNPPTIDSPIKLFISLTSDLPQIHYVAEIVGWDDKRKLAKEKREVIERLIDFLQKNEFGLYDAAKDGGESVNLLHIRRLRKLDKPFSVSQLIKTEDGNPVSGNRTTAGGWTYINTASYPSIVL